ncbi:Uncharacterised protein [Chlamydia trachomatis]|nr:Uncharacterised protein [Chlamydia trachomatis]
MKRDAFSIRLVSACFNLFALPKMSGASPVIFTLALRSCKIGCNVFTTSFAMVRKFTRARSTWTLSFSRRVSDNKSFTRSDSRVLSVMIVFWKRSRIAGGKSGSSNISAVPRMAVRGVRSSCAASLTNSA